MSDTNYTSPAAEVHETGITPAVVSDPVVITDMPGLNMTPEEILAAGLIANAGAAPTDPRETEVLVLRMEVEALRVRVANLERYFDNPRA